jgi:hypothetical protein
VSSEWTVDTLREHLGALMGEMKASLRQEVARERELANIRLDDMRAAVRSQADDRIRLLDERYATQTKALDAAFKAAEQAVSVALANAEKATAKAEAAADRRLEGMNEFREALSDQTKTLLSRAEYNPAHEALLDRIGAMNDRVSALELRLTSRLDTAQGHSGGEAAGRTERRLDTSQLLQALTVVVAIAAIIIAVFINR